MSAHIARISMVLAVTLVVGCANGAPLTAEPTARPRVGLRRVTSFPLYWPEVLANAVHPEWRPPQRPTLGATATAPVTPCPGSPLAPLHSSATATCAFGPSANGSCFLNITGLWTGPLESSHFP